MTLTPSKLSVEQLSERILTMAHTGVYRESIFETFQPVASQRQIRSAISQARQRGLCSVASLRDPDLGTYYQLDSAKYQLFQQLAQTPFKASLEAGGQLDQAALAQRLVGSAQVLSTMLLVAGGSATALFVLGSVCLLRGQTQIGGQIWLGAALTGGLWAVQRAIARPLL